MNEHAEDVTKYWSKSQKPLSEKAQRVIQDYLSPPSDPKTISMVVKQLETELKEVYRKQKIKSFVQKKMKFSYKKGSSRPPRYATRRIQLVKFLYWTELLDLIAKSKIIINVDESSFDRSIKREYSWLPIGRSFPIINDKIKGRGWLILAIWSTREWLSMVVPETIESKKFWLFIKILELVVCRYYQNCDKFPTIILDNTRTHSLKLTKRIIKGLPFSVRFLAPYCPEVAPVEKAFGIIKSKMRAIGGSKLIHFDKPDGIELIFELIASISQCSWKQTWIEIIKECKRTIIDSLKNDLKTNES